MTKLFRLNVNQELYQYGDVVHNQVAQLETVFPTSQFLKTQRALLYYHARGKLESPANDGILFVDFR